MVVQKKKTHTSPDAIESLLSRNVEEVFVRDGLRSKLLSGKVLRVKLGFDPTGPKVHIGRAIVLWKLREFQNLGHTIVFIVGDFTAQIGDPSDKLSKRPMLGEEEINKNMENYKDQVGKIIDLSKAEFHFNNTWLSKLSSKDIISLAESFSIQQMSNRRNFKERLLRGDEISLREFLYPLLQGFDSVAVKADVEIGGFDQLFNLKAGRIVQRHFKMPEQDVLTTQMLLGTDGRKMSTSWGNVIDISDAPEEMFGKVMSIKDELITRYFLLCTDFSKTDIEEFDMEMKSGRLNPRDAKLRLAKEIVTLYHGPTGATKAAESFEKVFMNGGMPDSAREVKAVKGDTLADLLIRARTVPSKSEFRRLVKAGAVSVVSGEVITDEKYIVEKSLDVRVGKHRFLKIIVS